MTETKEPALKINYIELPVENFDATQAFYEKAFGWTFTDYGPEYRAFNDGALEGGFYRSKLCSLSEHGGALVILYADDLEASRDKVQKWGGNIIKDIFSFPGGRRFQFTDPHGNELAIWTHQ